jgi:hypothetical protein
MNKLLLIILIILILGLIVYSFLGNKEGFTNNSNTNTNIYPSVNSESNNDIFPYTGVYNSNSSNNSNGYDNYNHYTGSYSVLNPGTYYEPNGGTITVTNNSDGSLSIQETNPINNNSNTYISSQSNPTSSTSTSYYGSSNGYISNNQNTNNNSSIYYGNNGGTATVITLNDGNQGIQVTMPNGNTVTYAQTVNQNNTTTSNNNISSSAYYGSTGTTIPNNYNLAYNTPSTTNSMNNNISNLSNPNNNSSSSNYQSILYGPNGAIAIVNNSTNSVMIIQNGVSTNYINQNPSQTSGQTAVLKSSNGGTLNVSLVNGQINLTLVDQYGNTEIFTMNPSQNSNSSFNINQYNGTTFYGKNGSTATLNSNTINLTTNGNTTTYTSYPYGSPNVFVNPNGETAVISQANNSVVLIVVDQYGNTQVLNINNPQTNSIINYLIPPPPPQPVIMNPYYGAQNSYSSQSNYNNSSPYNSVLPSGISKSQIPPGEEDLYILKSEVIPPVCPACPSVNVCNKKEKCPPCPACARCPEPSFECKKIPNYNSSAYSSSSYYGSSDLDSFETGSTSKYLPLPVLNDFSTFGM